MLCGKCDKGMKFKGIAQRGEGKDKEKWRCTCGYIEYITDWQTHPPVNELKGKRRRTKKKEVATEIKKKAKKRTKKGK